MTLATTIRTSAPTMTDIGIVNVPTALVSGQTTVTTSGTAVALGASTALYAGVTIKALSGNSGTIYIGDSDVDSTSGFELAAGESVFVCISDLATVYIDASSSGDGVSYIGS